MLFCVFDDLPDARDGLTRKERVVLWVMQRAEAERKGRGVRAAMLYGRVVEHVDMSIEEFMSIVERLSGMPVAPLVRSQQGPLPPSGRRPRR
jgi:hypothetical protein